MSFVLLAGRQLKELQALLLSAYSRRGDLERMLLFRLEKNLNQIATTGSLEEDVFRLVTRANSEGWIADLILELQSDRPLRIDLQRRLQQFSPQFEHDVGEEPPNAGNLESVLSLVNPLLNSRTWTHQLLNLEAQVCRIEIDGVLNGTGFLVGPNVVMTCYHVMETLISDWEEKQGPPSHKVVFRFDYHVTSRGATTRGVTCELAKKDWLLKYQPRSPMDDLPDPQPSLPSRKHLDYALLRIAKVPPGKKRYGLEPTKGSVKVADPLFIIGHPADGPGAQRLSLDTRAVVKVAGIGPRLRYRTNTLGGSSGSPCFTADWKLVAMHQGRDPATPPTFNIGIPFTEILPVLGRRETAKWLGQSSGTKRNP